MNIKQSIETQLDSIKNEILIGTIVKRIHKEWIAKFRINGRKITKRELDDLKARLEVQGFTCTFELNVSCYYCSIYLNNVKIDWYNLYFTVNSLENTVQIIDNTLKATNERQKKLLSELISVDKLAAVELEASTLCDTITEMIARFMRESQFQWATSTTQSEMPNAKLLSEFYTRLKS